MDVQPVKELGDCPHFHVLATDGVFAEEGEELKFIEATELTQEKIEEFETRVRRRVLSWLAKEGVLESPDVEDMLTWEHGGDFSVDGSVQIQEWDRQRCNAPMRIVSFITEPKTVTKILEHVDEPSTAPIIASARGPPQEEFGYDT